MKYNTNCVNSSAELINKMVEQSKEITYKTFVKHVSLDEILQVLPFYVKDKRQGLTLKNDWYVKYFKSRYNGKPCYYIVHSAIEYIFQ